MIQDITFGVITIPISLQEKRRKRVTTMAFIINFSIITFICFAVAKPAKTIIKSTINMFKEGEKA